MTPRRVLMREASSPRRLHAKAADTSHARTLADGGAPAPTLTVAPAVGVAEREADRIADVVAGARAARRLGARR